MAPPGLEDITDRSATERALRAVVQERNALLREIPDGVAASLRIVAGLLRSGPRRMDSLEARRRRGEAHDRVAALSALQRSLRAAEPGARVEVAPHLARLCETLSPVEPGGRRPLSVRAQAGPGALAAGQVVGIGLAATELMVNALEHAFPDGQDGGEVLVTFDQDGPHWILTVADNGIGRPEGPWGRPCPGLGTLVLEAVADRLNASMEARTGLHGMSVSVIHGAAFASRGFPLNAVRRVDSRDGAPDRMEPVDIAPQHR